MKNKIALLLQLSDREVGSLQFFFPEYITKYKDDLSKEDCYTLGVMGCNLQFSMRVLRERILNKDKTNADRQRNNEFIRKLESYDNLIDFIMESYISAFNSMDAYNRYISLKDMPNSYFNSSEEIRQALMNDIKLVKLDDDIEPIISKKSKAFVCDSCGKIELGKHNKVYDENHNIIKGLKYCNDCSFNS